MGLITHIQFARIKIMGLMKSQDQDHGTHDIFGDARIRIMGLMGFLTNARIRIMGLMQLRIKIMSP